MRKFLLLFIIVSCQLFINKVYTQTILSAGDIVFTGYTLDAGDKFSFVLLRDIDASTVIFFTDQGWDTGDVFYIVGLSEGIVQWTSGASLTCGTEVVVNIGLGFGNSTSSLGTALDILAGAMSVGANMDLSVSGDEVIAYQGSFASPTFISAFKAESTSWESSAGNVNDSRLPTGLTDGVDAFQLNPEQDNARYLCANGTTGTPSAINALVYANSSNTPQNQWESNNTTGYTLGNCSWTVSSCLFLPVDLIYFKAMIVEENVLTTWQTASELNNEGFDVERSSDGHSWETLGFVKGINHLENNGHQYSYIDQQPIFGKSLYRLKQVDLDGRFEYSNIASVDYIGENDLYIGQPYPNPASTLSTLKIKTFSSFNERIEVKIYELVSGRLLAYQSHDFQKGHNQLEIDIAKYPKGVYLVKMNINSKEHIRRFVVMQE